MNRALLAILFLLVTILSIQALTKFDEPFKEECQGGRLAIIY